jgi:hypothetical protein
MLLLAAPLPVASSGVSTCAAALGGQIVAEETIVAVPALSGGLGSEVRAAPKGGPMERKDGAN